MSRFNFNKKLVDPRITVPVDEYIFKIVVSIAEEQNVKLPAVAKELLRVGVEEYLKERTK